MKVEIISVKAKPFTGRNGLKLDYYWYTAKRMDNGARIQFGSTIPDHKNGSELELNLVKFEKSSGEASYKEILTPQSGTPDF